MEQQDTTRELVELIVDAHEKGEDIGIEQLVVPILNGVTEPEQIADAIMAHGDTTTVYFLTDALACLRDWMTPGNFRA